MSHLTFSTGITVHGDTYPFIAPSQYRGSLAGKVVLITGASRGIGRTTALSFAQAGAHVAALARSSSAIDELVAEIKTQYQVPAVAISGDVVGDAPALIKQVEAKLGPIDILVNNAGANRMARFADDADFSAWWQVFEVNARAPIALLHAVLPSFRARRHGTVITIGSAAADFPVYFLSAYAASKAAVQKAFQILDRELREYGVKNFVVHPGGSITDLSVGSGSIIGPEMQEIIDQYRPMLTDTMPLAGDSIVALAALSEDGKGTVDFLSGRYWDVKEDLEEILAKKEQIESGDLYHLRVQKL